MTKRHDQVYIEHMAKAAELTIAFVQGITKEQFEKDLMRQSAVMKQLEIIGEAAGNLSEKFRSDHPAIPWKKIIGMRNILIHAYHRANMDTIWRTTQKSIPSLLSNLKKISSVSS
ncbi:MAG: DUF86 domain-containing protein [Deltaproteobacteria bacterium]|nr:DUF86 domain-containing protein [Deltaproteobacteria bacterium]